MIMGHIVLWVFVDSREEGVPEIVVIVVIVESRDGQNISGGLVGVGDEQKGAAPHLAGHALHDHKPFPVEFVAGVSIGMAFECGRKKATGCDSDESKNGDSDEQFDKGEAPFVHSHHDILPT